MAAKHSIVIADDHAMFADAIRRALAPRCSRVTVVTSLKLVLDEIAVSKPDLLILDVMFGRRNSLSQVPKYLRVHSSLKVLVATGSPVAAFIEKAFAQGARGFIDKTEGLAELFLAIKTVVDGGVYVRDTYRPLAFPASCTLTAPLTKREEQVVALLQAGIDYAGVALHLRLSRRTVEDFGSSIRKKLGMARSNRRIPWQHVRLSRDACAIDAGSE